MGSEMCIRDRAETDGQIIGVAEIENAEDAQGDNPQDIDSTPDQIEDNDAGGAVDTPSDDVVDGDGTGNPGDENPATDEDDQDPEDIEVEIFDLALINELAEGEDELVYPGEDVTFTVSVTNQGTVDALDTWIVYYIPDGLELNDPDWTDEGDGTASYLSLIHI